MTIKNCIECSSNGACPFSFSDSSEMAQGYGCLPSPYDIVQMRQKHGKTWACHDNPNKPCLGALLYMAEKGLEYKVLDKKLITESDNWHIYCE